MMSFTRINCTKIQIDRTPSYEVMKTYLHIGITSIVHKIITFERENDDASFSSTPATSQYTNMSDTSL